MSAPHPDFTPSENENNLAERTPPNSETAIKDGSPPSEQPPAGGTSQTNLVRWLYNHNPFYLLSACLFVYGLKSIFRVGDSALLFEAGTVGYMEPWGLMLSLAAVTLLMSLTAVVIVRFGGVWEDARSIVMVVLLMFFAISVSFDELLTVKSDRDNGGTIFSVVLLMAASTFFCIGVSEILIRGLLVRLRWSWRLPLYLFLILFFGYPVLLLPEVVPISKTQIQWLTGGFPFAAGLIALTLIPAIRQGSSSVSSNGTPWSWPMFPWSPFVMIACAVLFRSFSLTISFDAPELTSYFWDSTFGVYLLVPFLLAVLVLLLEISIIEKLPRLQQGVLACAPTLLLIAYPRLVPWNRLPSYVAFVEQVTASMASPFYLTLFGLLVFFTWAVFRGVRLAETGVVLTLLGLAIVPTEIFVKTTAGLGVTAGRGTPLIILGLIFAVQFWRRRSSLAAGMVVLIVILGLRMLMKSHGLGAWNNFVSLNVLLIAAIGLGRALRDGFAEILQELAPPMLSFTTLYGSLTLHELGSPLIATVPYVLGMTAAAFVFGRIWKNAFWMTIFSLHCIALAAGATICGAWLFVMLKLPDGVKTVILAGLCFLLAVTVSGFKAGLGNWLKQWTHSFNSVTHD